MNYHERAQKIANDYRLSVVNPGPSKDLVKMIAEELKAVAREARKEVRRGISKKKGLLHEDITS